MLELTGGVQRASWNVERTGGTSVDPLAILRNRYSRYGTRRVPCLVYDYPASQPRKDPIKQAPKPPVLVYARGLLAFTSAKYFFFRCSRKTIEVRGDDCHDRFRLRTRASAGPYLCMRTGTRAPSASHNSPPPNGY